MVTVGYCNDGASSNLKSCMIFSAWPGDDSFPFQHVAQKWIIIMIYDLFRIFRLRLKSLVPSLVVFFHWLFQNDAKKRWEVVLKILHRLSMLVTLVRSGSSSISPSRSFPTLAWSCCWLLLVMLMIPSGNMTIIFLCENSGNQWEITKFFDSCYHAISSIYIHIQSYTLHIHSKLMQTVQLRRECWCLTSTPSQTLASRVQSALGRLAKPACFCRRKKTRNPTIPWDLP